MAEFWSHDVRESMAELEKDKYNYFIELGCASGWYKCKRCGENNSSGLGGWIYGKHHCQYCKGEGRSNIDG